MRAVIAAALLAALSAPAAAQTTNTDCERNVMTGSVSCTSRTTPAYPRRDPTQAYRNAYDHSHSRFEESQREDLHRKVGKLVSEGRCTDARNVALKAGDFDLAERAAGLCAAN